MQKYTTSGMLELIVLFFKTKIFNILHNIHKNSFYPQCTTITYTLRMLREFPKK